MHRFFVSKEYINKDIVVFEENIKHQINNVLRLNNGEEIVVFDNSGYEYLVELQNVNDRLICGNVRNKMEVNTEPLIEITLLQSVLKSNEKFEYILQKCTELGVNRFIPIITSRTIPRTTSSWINSKRRRWGKIICEAAEQSGRVILPELLDLQFFNEIYYSNHESSVILWEDEKTESIKSVLSLIASAKTNSKSKINLIVGPEGGFERSEIQYAKNTGIKPVSLGSRILRADTAGIAAVSCIMYEFNQFKP